MAELKVAVVIPYFNGAAFISEALAMLAAQMRQPDQIIIVDDGSAPHDAGVLAECAALHGAQILSQANQGPGVARNRGVAAADAELIAFLDVDDVWDNEKLEQQIACFQADEALDLVMCESRTARPDGGIDHVSTLAKFERDHLVDLILKGRIHSFTSSMLFRRSFFERLGGFEPSLRFREDHLLLMRSLIEGKVHILAAPLSTRRLHPNSMSGAGANPDLTLRLKRAELFWSFASRFVPRLPKRSLLAFEMQRLAKNYIVAGRPVAAIAASVHAFLLEPTRPKRLAYAGAAVWSCVQPDRFDHWHSGLASMRKLRATR